MSDIKKGISNEEIAIKYDVPKKNIDMGEKQGEVFQSTGSYSNCKGGRSCAGLDVLRNNFSVFSEKRGQEMQELLQEFQELLSLDKIDRLKQLLILNFLRKETKYSLILKFVRHLVPSCCD